ncbi:hypothetical protein [Brevibacterium linens]|nr:hypothetical protein [Brevibacterium linens]
MLDACDFGRVGDWERPVMLREQILAEAGRLGGWAGVAASV